MSRTAALRQASSRTAYASCAALLLLGLAGCGDEAAVADRASSTSAAVSAPAVPGPSRSPLLEEAASPAPSASPAGPIAPSPPAPAPGSATGPGTTSRAPLPLPSGPAVAPTPAAPPAPGSLAGLDWSGRSHPAACASPRVGTVVAGDLDGDRVDEVAVPLSCPDGAPSSVLVYAGDPAAPRLLGDALPREERARVQAVEVRDGHLVVGALTWKDAPRSGEPDTALTTRWVVQDDRLVRTDRWEDPAHLLEVDEEH